MDTGTCAINILKPKNLDNSNVRASWVRVGDIGFLAHEWRCSACKESWEVKGIMTPKGLGHNECPNCHAQMVDVIQ